MNTTIQPRRRLIRKILLIVLGLGACAGVLYIGFMLLVFWAFSGLGNMFNSPVCKPSTPSGIESVAHIKLPPSAAHLQSGCGGMQGIYGWAYFDMKPSDLETFINSTNVKLPLAATGKPARLECLTCNKLTALTSYLYGTYETHYDTDLWFEEIFIDTSNPAQYRVYFTLLAG